MSRFEFMSTVLFHHLYFQEDIVHGISLQFPAKDGFLASQEWQGFKSNQSQEFNYRNAYKNGREFKIEGFKFEYLFQKIGEIEKILGLVRALLLEKKIIMIKEDISDIAVIMQGLLTLLSPFKWNYTVITNLPVDMIEALESPMPFLIGI